MIFFVGDPHGEFEDIMEAADAFKPAAIVLLGDQTPQDDYVLRELNDLVPVYFILGNHDGDQEIYLERHKWLMDAGRDLGGRVIELDGIRVAGLGGVFRGKQCWMPPHDPVYRTRQEAARYTPRQTRFWGGPPRKHWASIWWEDYEHLWDRRADILVTHEAPETHSNGFGALGDLARAMGVRKYFHGHHHTNYARQLPASNCVVESVALGGIKTENGESLVVGVDYATRGHRDTRPDWLRIQEESGSLTPG